MNTRLAKRFPMPKPLCERKIVAVDFDGTLVKNKYPFIENPNEELLEFIRSHRVDYCWILWTCRSGVQLEYAVKWLKDEQGIEFDFVNENVPWLINEYGETRKLSADYYIDDRNVLVNDLKPLYDDLNT